MGRSGSWSAAAPAAASVHRDRGGTNEALEATNCRRGRDFHRWCNRAVMSLICLDLAVNAF
jgi:hypothetical protein